MKNSLTTLLLVSNLTFACPPPSERTYLSEGDMKDFNFEEKTSPGCTTCKTVTLKAPKTYKGEPYSHGMFSVNFNNEVISKTFHGYQSKNEIPEFIGVVNEVPGIRYSVSFEYGSGKCMDYEFLFEKTIPRKQKKATEVAN